MLIDAQKHHAAGTPLWQANDAHKLHSGVKSFVKTYKDGIYVGLDDSRVPKYMSLIYNLLKHYKFTAAQQRTFYKLFQNMEYWLCLSFTRINIIKAYAMSVQWPWILYYFINKWAGKVGLTYPNDYEYIASKMPEIITVCLANGGAHRSFVMSIMGEFIYQKQHECLSDIARQFIYQSELTKPIEQRDLSQFPSWIISNPGFLQKRKEAEIAKLRMVEENLLIEEDRRMIQEELALEMSHKVAALYDIAQDDFDEGKLHEHGLWNNKKYPFKAEVYKAAWKHYVPHPRGQCPTTILGCIKDLTETFEEFMSGDAT